jgi:hypothetical protein
LDGLGERLVGDDIGLGKQFGHGHLHHKREFWQLFAGSSDQHRRILHRSQSGPGDAAIQPADCRRPVGFRTLAPLRGSGLHKALGLVEPRRIL